MAENDTGIDAMVKSVLQARIIEAFKSTPAAIDDLVRAALEAPVNEYGGAPKDRYGRSTDSMPWLTWRTREIIQSVAKEAVKEILETKRDEIKRAVAAKFSEAKMADSLVDSVVGSADLDWRIDVKFIPPEKETQ